MAGTRGLAQFKGSQLNQKIMRDRHFDETNKINEKFIDIDFNAHREILEDTKVDIFSQVNDVNVQGLNSIDITDMLGGKAISTGVDSEGVVTGNRVDLRVSGTDDFPLIDPEGDKVYGRIRHSEEGVFLDFYSPMDDGTGNKVETPYTFATDAPDIDFRYVLRTNLAVLPVDSIVNGGAGFVEGATDANAYMNLLQLMKDVYGPQGSLDNDGNPNLGTSIVNMIINEGMVRGDADKAIIDDLNSTSNGKGAALIGVVVDSEGNYVGGTVQEVLTELASTVAEQVNNNIEVIERVTKLEIEDVQEVYEAVGGEVGYTLVDGVARPKTLFLSINGQLQVPGINYEEVLDTDGNITGVTFAPDTLEVNEGVPDVLFLWYKRVFYPDDHNPQTNVMSGTFTVT